MNKDEVFAAAALALEIANLAWTAGMEEVSMRLEDQIFSALRTWELTEGR